MSENLDAEAEATGSDEVLTTGDPEQPSGSEEGSQSSDSEEENDSEAFQRLEEQLKDMESWATKVHPIGHSLFTPAHILTHTWLSVQRWQFKGYRQQPWRSHARLSTSSEFDSVRFGWVLGSGFLVLVSGSWFVDPGFWILAVPIIITADV
ncbi:GD15546 [Drosophila simulans]|uniref:GD15546 n=1 Tax=Drosophila simulans TaxID=7240 RepID=B4R2X1_DROSI|nr:GD15546 [Drosophila simulans]